MTVAGCADDDSSATSGEATTTAADSGGTADSGTAGTGEVAATCGDLALEALSTCVADYGTAIAGCYAGGSGPCGEDANTTAALDALQASVAASCSEGEFGALSLEGLTGRLRNACASEASSLAWRTYGGPQGAVWASGDATARACMSAAHEAGTQMFVASLASIGECLAGDACDLATLTADRDAQASDAQTAIGAACDDLASLVAVGPAEYVKRAAQQVDCLTAAGHPTPGAAEPKCGPSYAQFEAPRGQWTQVIVDGDEFGSLCGDGSAYAFQIKLAPEGQPLDRIMIGLQGGGVCVFEEDCTAKLASSPGLFNAQDDVPVSIAIASDDPAESPFANWTKVYMPYCTQDVFAGGGETEVLGALEVPRYGGVNLRAALRMVRDVTWKMMDEAGGDGFRPDQLVAMFGGWSAGAYGTMYNYHWLLDDLQWPNTIAFPDAGLALDNGTALGVRGLGLLKVPLWGTEPNLPPYCFAGECAVGPVLLQALSPRLEQTPQQHMLLLSNPLDNTQMGDAYFDDQAVWINTMRQSYCDTHELPGVSYYFTSVSDTSIHVVSIQPDLWNGEVDGEVMRDFFIRAVEDPDTMVDRVEEGDFVDAIPGVEPYPCEVAP